MRLHAAAVLAAAALLALAGCGDHPRAAAPAATATPSPSATPRPARTARPHPRHVVPRLRCPAGVAGCAAVRGPVVYVERVDPDGDGDLHVVVVGGNVTAPGFTAIDVRAGLRPRHDPRIGDVVSAYGPVQPGHLRQAQIHALAFRTARN